jgi:hypothetical protein
MPYTIKRLTDVTENSFHLFSRINSWNKLIIHVSHLIDYRITRNKPDSNGEGILLEWRKLNECLNFVYRKSNPI